MTGWVLRLCIVAECTASADAFALFTHHEDWANALLEAMACGRPAVNTEVGGNAEVVCDDSLGILVPFGAAAAIRRYAERHAWDLRVQALIKEFRAIHATSRAVCASPRRPGHV